MPPTFGMEKLVETGIYKTRCEYFPESSVAASLPLHCVRLTTLENCR